MEKKRNLAILACVGIMVFSFSAMSGDLEPSAPPGPTMKTLDEVEPRVPIHASDLPLTISEPNSYYLVEDVDFMDTANHAITIECNDVTIDLMGYTLKGPDAGDKCGVYSSACSNIEIRNGTVRDFGDRAIYGQYWSGYNHRIIDIRAISCQYGIYLEGYGCMVNDCMAAENGSTGIYAGVGAKVVGNVCYENGYTGLSASSGSTVIDNTCDKNGNYGIYAGGGSTVSKNTAYNNGSHGIDTNAYCTVTGNTTYDNKSYGIDAGSGSTVTGNSSTGNDGIGIRVNSYGTISGNTVCSNQNHGISAGSYSLVTNNVLRANNSSDTVNQAGIYANADCMVKSNTLTGNLQNNIYVYSNDNAIEENLLTDSDNGINFRVTGNFYANNRASGNTTDYANTVGQTDGGGNFSF